MTTKPAALARVLFIGRQAMRLGFRGMSVEALLVVAVPAAFVLGSYAVTAATTLSPGQQRIMNFGEFEASAGYGSVEVKPGDDAVAREIDSRVAATHPKSWMTSITAVNFYVVGLSEPRSRYEEHPWSPQPFPGRYTLLRGRWPAATGEIVVSGDPNASVGKVIRAGLENPLIIVGVVDDLYARQPAILAAPGTWRSLSPDLTERYQTMRGQPVVYWSTGDDERILSAITDAVREGGPASSSITDTVLDSYSVAPSGNEVRQTPWIDKLPMAYLIPAGTFPALTVALTLALTNGRLKRLMRTTRGLGIPTYVAVLSHTIPTCAAATVAAAGGALVGLALPHLARPAIEEAASRPVDLDIGATDQVAKYVVAVAISGVILSMGLTWQASRKSQARPPRPGRLASRRTAALRPTPRRAPKVTTAEWRRLVALGLGCAGLVAAASADTPGAIMLGATLMMLGVLCLLTDAMQWAATRSSSKWHGRLASARTVGRMPLTVATASTLALVIGITFGYLIVIQTWVTSAQGDRAPAVAPREVLVADRSSKLFEPNQATAATVRSLLEPHQGFPLKWSIRLDREGAELSKASLGASPKPVLLAQDADEVKAILGHNPTRGESAILGSGGVVLWHGGAYPGDPGSTARRSLEVSQNQPQQPSRVQTIDTIISSVPASQWRYSAVGVMDAAAAAKRGLPSTQGAILFAGLSDEATSEVTSAALELGLDPDTVIGYRPPETVVPALALPGVGVALSALMFLLCTATTWVSAKDNRSFLQTLLALGIAPRAARRVLGKQFGLMFSVAGIGGLVIAAIPVASVVTFLPGYDLSLPTSNLVVLTGAVVVGCASSVAAASMRLTATGSGL